MSVYRVVLSKFMESGHRIVAGDEGMDGDVLWTARSPKTEAAVASESAAVGTHNSRL
jgi:hypothetical protein